MFFVPEASEVKFLTSCHYSPVVLTAFSSMPPAVPSDSVSPEGRSKILPTFTDSAITADCEGWHPIIYSKIKRFHQYIVDVQRSIKPFMNIDIFVDLFHDYAMKAFDMKQK